jgi:rhodanese-related sulfurtransferase
MRKAVADARILIAAAFLVLGLGCGGADRQGSGTSGPPAGAPKVEAISAADAAARVKAGSAVLVDVREADEIATGMAEPAVWMPSSRIGGEEWKRFVAAIPKEQEVILYCRSGRRSHQAGLRLASLGYRTSNMGGFSAWTQAGLPVETPTDPQVGK